MGIYRSRVSSKGQVVIPVELRREKGLQEGTEVVFEEDAEGRIVLSPPAYEQIYKLRGCLAGQRPSAYELLQEERRRERRREERKR